MNNSPFSSASSKEATLIMFYDQKHKPHLQEIYSHPCLPCIWTIWTFMELSCLKKHLQEGKGYTNSQTISLLLYNTWRVVGVQSTVQKNLIKSWMSKIDTFSSTPFSISNRCWYHVGSKSMFLPNHHKLCCVCHLYILYIYFFCLRSYIQRSRTIQHHGSTWVDTKPLLQVEALA